MIDMSLGQTCYRAHRDVICATIVEGIRPFDWRPWDAAAQAVAEAVSAPLLKRIEELEAENPWLEYPDGEGWFWREHAGSPGIPPVVVCVIEVDGVLIWRDTQRCVGECADSSNRKWQRIKLPKMPEVE